MHIPGGGARGAMTGGQAREGDQVPALEALTSGQRVILSPIDKRKGNMFLNRGVTISRGSCLEAQVSPGFN